MEEKIIILPVIIQTMEEKMKITILPAIIQTMEETVEIMEAAVLKK